MKISPFFYVAFTTFLLIIITIMSAMNLPFNWIFFLSLIGQFFVLIMVYKVLKDNYSTSKTFEDFYEDHSINTIKILTEESKFRQEKYR